MKFEHFRHLVDGMFQPDSTGGILQHYDHADPHEVHPLVLAYLGDAYFHLFVRGRLLSYEQRKVHVLNEFGAQMVSANWQALALHAIEEQLTPEEHAVYRRARNAQSHAPRRTSVAIYHTSTGFEALLGYLYLTEEFPRLEELAELSFQALAKGLMEDRQKKQEKEKSK